MVAPIPQRIDDAEELPACVEPTFDQLTDPDPMSFAMDSVIIQEFPDMLIDVSTEERGDELVGVIEQER